MLAVVLVIDPERPLGSVLIRPHRHRSPSGRSARPARLLTAAPGPAARSARAPSAGGARWRTAGAARQRPAGSARRAAGRPVPFAPPCPGTYVQVRLGTRYTYHVSRATCSLNGQGSFARGS